MLILVMGANGSGKSVWAEQLVIRLGRERLIYIATMIPYGAEGQNRVARHRAQRRDSGFITFEIPHRLARAQLQAGDTVLLEDVANLTANALFMAAGDAPGVLDEITALEQRVGLLIAVTISGLMPQDAYDEATNRYIGALRQVNEGLFALAAAVYEMKAGRPSLKKGAAPCPY